MLSALWLFVISIGGWLVVLCFPNLCIYLLSGQYTVHPTSPFFIILACTSHFRQQASPIFLIKVKFCLSNLEKTLFSSNFSGTWRSLLTIMAGTRAANGTLSQYCESRILPWHLAVLRKVPWAVCGMAVDYNSTLTLVQCTHMPICHLAPRPLAQAQVWNEDRQQGRWYAVLATCKCHSCIRPPPATQTRDTLPA
jgi:hypothetical protein